MSGLACSIPEAVRTVEELCQVCHHRHHHHHHYNRHHHPRNKLADQAELFNPNGGDRFWPEHFWPMSRSSQVCRGMFLIIRNLKYFDTIQTFLIRQNWGVKKQCLLYFSILIFKYIFFARHIALGLTQHTSFPLTKRFPVAFKIHLGFAFGQTFGRREISRSSWPNLLQLFKTCLLLSSRKSIITNLLTGGLQVSPSSFCVPANMWSSHPGIVINNYEMIKHL